MIDKRILNMQAMIKEQHALGIASDEALEEINGIVADARRKAAQQYGMTGDRIRALRTRERLSQSQLAKYLYLSPNSVQKWERGTSQPKGAALAMLELLEKKGVAVLQS